MRSPFPGMDPYIEAYGPWEDFHDSLIAEIKRALTDSLPERYVVLAGVRAYVDYIDPRDDRPRERFMKPDVGIWSTPGGRPSESATAVLEAPPGAVSMTGLIEVEYREVFLEIRELDPERRLVTCIEALSPTNKIRGAGWEQYQRKRQVFLQGHANLVEIDLLRSGLRMPTHEPWPDSPYGVFIVRKENAPRGGFYRAHFREPLPTVPVPLAAPDPDIRLSLQPLVDSIYEGTRYHRLLDYRRPLQPPFAAEDERWFQERLQTGQAKPN